MSNRWWSDPLIKGEGEPVRAYGVYHTRAKDMPRRQTRLDFFGVNVYSPFQKSWNAAVQAPEDRKNSLGWLIDGRCLYWTLRFLYECYRLPLMVTENGMCDSDAHDRVIDGRVHDEKRIGFLREYLSNVARAIGEGIPVLGYQYWSLLDNFEWAEGYAPRFGIVHVDYKTQIRTPKDSACFYSEVIRSNGEKLT